ncbi:MAG: hypothetical protein NTAFB01_15040 [Nitrospira sp.]
MEILGGYEKLHALPVHIESAAGRDESRETHWLPSLTLYPLDLATTDWDGSLSRLEIYHS